MFQTKGGDIGLKGWREARGQIDEMRTNVIAHPAFDEFLPRKAVFVTTGSLVGAAPAEAQQYRNHLSKVGELGFVTWERSDLSAMIAALPDSGFAAYAEGELLVLLGQIDQSACTDQLVEQYSRRWILPADSTKGLWRAGFEAAIVAHRLSGKTGPTLLALPPSVRFAQRGQVARAGTKYQLQPQLRT